MVASEAIYVQEMHPADDLPLLEMEESPECADDRRLLNQALAGNLAAFHLLVDRHQRALYLFCYRLLGDQEGARDVMQEMWLRVVGLRDAGRVANPTAFLYRIARNLSLDHLKRQRRQSGRLASFHRLHEHQHTADASMEEAVQGALDTIPLKYREVLILRYYSGYRYEEIAEMMNLSVGAVTMRHKRALERMRRAIAAEE